MPSPSETARSETVWLEPRNRSELEQERTSLLGLVNLPKVRIETNDQYAEVVDIDARFSRFIGRVKPTFDEHCATIYRAWKQACEIRTNFLEVPEQIRKRARELLSE